MPWRVHDVILVLVVVCSLTTIGPTARYLFRTGGRRVQHILFLATAVHVPSCGSPSTDHGIDRLVNVEPSHSPGIAAGPLSPCQSATNAANSHLTRPLGP